MLFFPAGGDKGEDEEEEEEDNGFEKMRKYKNNTVSAVEAVKTDITLGPPAVLSNIIVQGTRWAV